MKNLENVTENERLHYTYCMHCEDWYDLRDLAAVFAHEHWLKPMPDVSFAGSKRRGKKEEVYVKLNGKMITLFLPPNRG